MKNCVYILLCKNGNYYIGSTHNLYARLEQHWCGLVKTTKNLRPLFLLFFQSFSSIKYARQVEYRLKKFKNKKIIKKIISDGQIKSGPM
ncbi:GIY-YIG nuclease family protein [Patescibacteria group bacterium]|nr:GIY-YIG nuclease family protein [Patescibacteria group bacterium]